MSALRLVHLYPDLMSVYGDRGNVLTLVRRLEWRGIDVQVTNLSWNGGLAANGGNSADIGFVGANNGAYPSPAAITLNGTVCTTTYSS